MLCPALLALALASESSACQPIDMAAVPGAILGALSQPGASHTVPFVNNTNAGCQGAQYKGKPCAFVDTAKECRDGCVATPGCNVWSVFGTCNTGPKPPGGRTKHSCLLQNLTHQSNDGDGHYISGMLAPLPPANAWPVQTHSLEHRAIYINDFFFNMTPTFVT